MKLLRFKIAFLKSKAFKVARLIKSKDSQSHKALKVIRFSKLMWSHSGKALKASKSIKEQNKKPSNEFLMLNLGDLKDTNINYLS